MCGRMEDQIINECGSDGDTCDGLVGGMGTSGVAVEARRFSMRA